jgi:hypothetical protein
MEIGWLPITIPFVFESLLGDEYHRVALDYTLVPIMASLRWQMNDVRDPSILRGQLGFDAHRVCHGDPERTCNTLRRL